ncbi:MAG: low molecular weight phosphatase family protein [Pirellulaceae bacterium]
MKRLLFLCTGNYYRSRFAEILFNRQAIERGLAWRADSRGLNPDPRNPGPISVHALAALEKLAISTEACQRLPLPATSEDFQVADYIVAVKHAEHHPLISTRFGNWLDRVEFWHVHDIDCATPDVALPHLQAEVLALVERLAAPTYAGGQ